MIRGRFTGLPPHRRCWPGLLLVLATAHPVLADQPAPVLPSSPQDAATEAPSLLPKLPFLQQSSTPAPTAPPAAPASAPDQDLLQIGCTTCGGGLGGHFGTGMPHVPGLPCVPGREPCHDCDKHGTFGRFFCNLYDCICCPDPCYDPRWLPVADASFFVDAVRPQTQTRIRWDSGLNLQLPDRAEFFWPRADGQGKGPKPPTGYLGETSLKYNDVSLYVEAATGKLGVFTETPYRSLDPDGVAHASGFGDMNVGTKTLLFDCELLQVALQFRTYIPLGSFFKGLGNGHIALEPSLLVGLRIGPDTYLQSQISEWIPLGGDPNYSGAILHYHFGLNHVWCRILPDVPLIGTCEFNGWSFQDGAYTDPILGSFQKAGAYTYMSAAAGLRLFVCDRIDFGFAAAFAVTEEHWASQLYRTEFRYRF